VARLRRQAAQSKAEHEALTCQLREESEALQVRLAGTNGEQAELQTQMAALRQALEEAAAQPQVSAVLVVNYLKSKYCHYLLLGQHAECNSPLNSCFGDMSILGAILTCITSMLLCCFVVCEGTSAPSVCSTSKAAAQKVYIMIIRHYPLHWDDLDKVV